MSREKLATGEAGLFSNPRLFCAGLVSTPLLEAPTSSRLVSGLGFGLDPDSPEIKDLLLLLWLAVSSGFVQLAVLTV